MSRAGEAGEDLEPMASRGPTPLQWTPELVARFWDFESRTHSNYFAEQFGAAIVGSFADLLPENATVLDYGCGAGGLLPHLLPRGGRVWGLDQSPASREEVRRRFGTHPSFAGALAPTEAPALAGKTDVVFCVEVIEHLDDANLARLVANVHALLKLGGIAIFTTPNREVLEESTIYCPGCEALFHRWQHVRSFDPTTLGSLLARAGFVVARTLETDFRAHKAVSRKRWLRRWLRELRRKRVRSPHVACAARRGKS
jgi:2-polyprenyl-3-methyl-5-hydroxy-6-metoxy-1,4-benzoquinol methylase